MNPDEFLETAVRIGGRIVRNALWEGPRCTWEIRVPDRSSPQNRYSSIPQVAPGTLYQGSSGIGLFLTELARFTGDRRVAHTAEGAICHALKQAASMPHGSFGFHGGRVGISYAALRFGQLMEKSEYFDAALKILEPLRGNERQDSSLDLIGGAAGAIPALIDVYRHLQNEMILEIACSLGDHLIERALHEPRGWAWETMPPPTIAHPLTGLAHGAAGIGLSLLELSHATGCGKYRFGADMAFLYERQFLSCEKANWPDFRRIDVWEILEHRGMEELRKAAREGAIENYQLKYMTAWCHGSPGIGLSRLRAYELTGDEAFRQETEIALKSTLSSLESGDYGMRNFSLCHGVAGNCELPLEASFTLDNSSLRQKCEEWAEQGWNNFECCERPWPCGTSGAASDPSLMLGEAGIGFFYLRLYSDQVPSVLLLHPRDPRTPISLELDSYNDLLCREVHGFLGSTLKSLTALGVDWPDIAQKQSPPQSIPISPVEKACKELCEVIEHQKPSSRELLEDAFRLDRARFETSLELGGLTDVTIDALARRPVEEIEWHRVQLSLPPCARLVVSRWDWLEWLSSRNSNSHLVLPPEREQYRFLFARGNSVGICPIGRFAAAILSCLETPLSLANLVRAIAATTVATKQQELEVLAEQTKRQCIELYRGGLVDAK